MSSSKIYEFPKELDESSLKVAKKELNEKDAKQVAADIQYIRDWILKQDYMKSRTDDQFILMFLRTAKFSYTRAQELIKNYWMHRVEMPEFFKNRSLNDDSVLMEISDAGIMFALPYPDNEGRRIIISRFGSWDPIKHSHADVVKFGMTTMDYLVQDPRLQVNGLVLFMDLSGFNASHVTSVTPARSQKLMKAFQDGFPLRIKAIHYYNYPKIFDTAFSIIKMFMKEKLRKRLNFHGSDLASVHKHIPKTILPKEYGGEIDSVVDLSNYWAEYMKSKPDYLNELEKLGVDPSKIPKTEDNKVLGTNSNELVGTFKKLNVD